LRKQKEKFVVQWPDDIPGYFRYWGKARPGKIHHGDEYHLLVWHCLDVAACAHQMVKENRYGVTDTLIALGFSDEEGARWFSWLAATHDIGKFARGFQGLASCGNGVLVAPLAGKKYYCRHDSLGYFLWHRLSESWLEDDTGLLPACSERDAQEYLDAMDIWMQISTGHHGIPPEIKEHEGHLAFDPSDMAAVHAFIAALNELFGFTHWPECWKDAEWQKSLKQHSWQLAGAVTLADWLGSDNTRFPWSGRPVALAGYWAQALNNAQAAVSAIPPASAVSKYPGFLPMFPFLRQPTPLQQYAATLDICAPGPQLMVLEDVTGAGKTEAAMILAHRMMSAGKGRGLYVGLPTMATANAMYARLAEAYRALFEIGQRPSLVLAHGGRQMSMQFRDSVWHSEQRAPEHYTADEPGAGSECSAWFADSRKKALLAEVGVGTLDQLLMAVMPFCHQSLRLLGMRDKILLLDEVHAYDGYMVRLLEGLLFFHAAQGGSVIILSATLHYALRERLLAAFAAGAGFVQPQPSPQAGYPWFTRLTSAALEEKKLDTRKAVARHVSVGWFSCVDEGIALIYRAAAAGESVCWIRNTVDDAIAVYRRLLDEGVIPADNLLLFHSRFAFADRLNIENQALHQFGKASSAQLRRGKVLIATQVIEQSLDIDVDNMLTDLAPVDLLIQRAGRLQRHIRTARGDLKIPLPGDNPPPQADDRAQPVLHVLAPEWQPEPHPGWLGEALRGTGYVYADHVCLWRTQRLLRELSAIRMPDDARRLVEGVYGEDEPVPPGLERNADEALGLQLSQRAAAKNNLLVRDRGYDRSASDYMWDDAKDISTRLSEEGVEVFLAYPDGESGLRPYADEGEFSWEMSRLQVRETWWKKHSRQFALPPQEALAAFRTTMRRHTAQVLLVSEASNTGYYSAQYGLVGNEG
jgi:CRISPR-associated endonuclease/helicase Cas3